MNRLLLIGGSGFVGTRLLERVRQSHHCMLFDKQVNDAFAAITIQGDVRDLQALKGAMRHADTVVLLAAEHRDDVQPVSLYYDVNVEGARNVLAAMDECGVTRIIFTSSVAVYALGTSGALSEEHPTAPWNHYGKSKLAAEDLLREWCESGAGRSLVIVRPSVIFGEGNRGNVYNLLRQIASGRFMMIGSGQNRKSMAYVGNVSAFIEFLIENMGAGQQLFNYVDMPDLSMSSLVSLVGESLGRSASRLRLPYSLGMLGGYGCDLIARISGRKLPVSAVRVKKFCAATRFDATRAHSCGFVPPCTLEEGLRITLKSEFDGEIRIGQIPG
ncbi:MAG TPA: NAD-dependent epimerase/dehydratase family protein [Desulfuromonadales bacterium]|nr:NAD-dependent epimerase/dehydratase family protein [Desulfuromonadales bacterium]